jgi:hypothetical protein
MHSTTFNQSPSNKYGLVSILSFAVAVLCGCSTPKHRPMVDKADASHAPSPALPVARVASSESDLNVQEVEFDWQSLSEGERWVRYNELRGDPYPLDSFARFLEQAGQPLPCTRDNLVVYRGSEVRVLPVSVHAAFVSRLQRFERAVAEIALELYQRRPARIRHLGGYSCRKSRFRSRRISEHALGNAIDVNAFDFGPAPKDAELDHLPRALRWSFQVRVRPHWQADANETLALHAEFLRRVTERVVDDGIFRIAIGPSHRGHADHFHFDMSPWTYVHL